MFSLLPQGIIDARQQDFDNLLQPVLDYLKEHGRSIGAKANAGDEHCAKIVRWYTILRRLPEPGALVVLTELINQYKKESSCQPASS